jgi:hypothetical protein
VFLNFIISSNYSDPATNITKTLFSIAHFSS